MRWPEYAELARTAEKVGFDSVWVGDHYLYREPERGPWEAWALLAGLAAVTERVALGPLVACLNFHVPAVLAKAAATVDEISGGRLVLGVGSGWNEDEFRAFGIPFDHRVSRFEEAFEIVRRLLAGEGVTFSGRYSKTEDAVLLPAPARRVPLMVGATGERMRAITLPHVDAWNTWFDWYGNTPEGFARRNGEISAAAEGVGRAPVEIERSACVFVELDRAVGRRTNADTAPVTGTRLGAHLRELGEAGADEAILVVDPIDRRAIEELREAL